MEKLTDYNKKRDFERTDEPKGKIFRKTGRRFVVQHHIASRDHYDFRLEMDGVLVSWAVPKGPSFDTRDKRLAVHVEDHPLDYKDFEGTIPKGQYGGGTVMLWDEGYWSPQDGEPCDVRGGQIKIVLDGKRLKGKWALIRMKDKPGDKADNWLLIKEKDEFALNEPGIDRFTTGIKSGRTMKEIETGQSEKLPKNPFDKTDVQLAVLAQNLPTEGKWIYELKYDGYRIIAYVEGGEAVLLSRNSNDYTKHFSDIAQQLARLSAGVPMVLDGEMIVTDERGRSDFSEMQRYIKERTGNPPQYMIFDLLAYGGEDLRGTELLKRKAKLKKLLKNAPEGLMYSEHTDRVDKQSFENLCSMNLEGLIAKKADSVYGGKRNGDWLKLKCDTRQEFVIGGYTVSDKKAEGISSLLLGYFDGGDLIYAGRTGTGMSESVQKDLETKFQKLMRKTSPFTPPPVCGARERLIWVKPECAAEVKFAEWTSGGLLRQAGFKGLRTDKNPNEIVREDKKKTEKVTQKTEATVCGVEISNPQKLMFTSPKVTKLAVAEYYEAVSVRMMPYVQNRIMSLVCCPKGVSGACHFRKHLTNDARGLEKAGAIGKKNDGDYFYITDVSGLIYLVQMNTVEFHTWAATGNRVENPDIMVFDLDPDEGMDLSSVRRGAADLKSILDELKLTSFLKTSGGKGYHIVVPHVPVEGWEQFRLFAKNVAEIMEQKWPERYTTNMRKEKRKGKIFIDWVRNGRGATSVAPYSLRARRGATVSMPISWDELYSVKPDGITIDLALQRLKNKDPWSGFFKHKK